MSNAEERALEAYPIAMSEYSDSCREYDSNESDRLTFIEGYHQAENDLELTWEDIKDILNIYEKVIDMDSCEDIYGEVLKQFRDYKKKKINYVYRSFFI